MQGALSTSERWLRGVLIGHAILSALLAVGYIVDGDTRTLVVLPNSFAKDVLFVVLSAGRRRPTCAASAASRS